MSWHVLDSDTLSLLQEGHPAVLKRVAACPAKDLAITVVSVEEQWSTARGQFIQEQVAPPLREKGFLLCAL